MRWEKRKVVEIGLASTAHNHDNYIERRRVGVVGLVDGKFVYIPRVIRVQVGELSFGVDEHLDPTFFSELGSRVHRIASSGVSAVPCLVVYDHAGRDNDALELVAFGFKCRPACCCVNVCG